MQLIRLWRGKGVWGRTCLHSQEGNDRGGIAGMEAARVAALRGHQVLLFEKQTNWEAMCEKLRARF